jgi:cytochrome c-type protein NapC
MKRKYALIGITMFAAGAAGVVLFNQALEYTNRTEFCVSCHSMQVPYAEYKQSPHYRNASGIVASCADCHVPKSFLPKMRAKLIALKDIYHEMVGTIDSAEKYEAQRDAMAERVWAYMRETGSRECRSCHDIAQMDTQRQSDAAREEHAVLSLDSEVACIDCHTCIAHK